MDSEYVWLHELHEDEIIKILDFSLDSGKSFRKVAHSEALSLYVYAYAWERTGVLFNQSVTQRQ